MKTLGDRIEDRIRIDADVVILVDPVGQLFLLDLFDLKEFFLQLLIVNIIHQLGNLLEILAVVRTDVFIEQGTEFRIGVK